MYMFYSWNILTLLKSDVFHMCIARFFKVLDTVIFILRNAVQGVPLKSYSGCPQFSTQGSPCRFFLQKKKTFLQEEFIFQKLIFLVFQKCTTLQKGHSSVNISKMDNFTRGAYVSQKYHLKNVEKEGVIWRGDILSFWRQESS